MDKRKRRLLCMLEGSGRKSRWISGAPPLSFKAKKAGMLENYRIYGNTVGGESVGDLVESGEHAGEYKVPVTVEGKNLLPNTAISQTINGVTFTVNGDGSVTCNGTCVNNIAVLHIRRPATFDDETIQYTLTGCPAGGEYNSTYALEYSNGVNQSKPDVGNGVSFTPYKEKSYPYAMVRVIIFLGYTCNNLTFYPMIRKADIEDDTYEPYHAPVTTPIYLPEPIKMVGGEAEFIDYAEQKMHRIGAEDIDVILPELPTLAGTNVLSVGTAVQPSEIEVKGKIKAL